MLKIAKESIDALHINPEMILRDDADAVAFRLVIPLPESREYNKDSFTAVLNFMVHPITKTITSVLWSDSLANVTYEPEKSKVVGLDDFMNYINCPDFVYIDDDNDIRIKLAISNVEEGKGEEISLFLVKQMSKLANVVYSYMHKNPRQP